MNENKNKKTEFHVTTITHNCHFSTSKFFHKCLVKQLNLNKNNGSCPKKIHYSGHVFSVIDCSAETFFFATDTNSAISRYRYWQVSLYSMYIEVSRIDVVKLIDVQYECNSNEPKWSCLYKVSKNKENNLWIFFNFLRDLFFDYCWIYNR